MIRKRRFHVVLGILVVLVALISYAEQQAAIQTERQLGTADWRVKTMQAVTNDENRLSSPMLPQGERAALKAAIAEANYALNHNINPSAPGAPTFMRNFMDEGILLLIPLLVVVIASDIVSSEASQGTIKVLLTRPVSRTAVLSSKLVALVLLVSALTFSIAVVSFGVSGLFFGYHGLGMPVPVGFQTNASGTVDVSHVHTIPQWQYIWMTFGLGYFVSLCVAAMSFMVSIVVRTTASAMGIMMAALIAGTLLTALAGNWPPAKYLPVVNLQLSDYLTGAPPPVPGMTFTFSVSVLLVWSVAAVVIGFVVFQRRDILG